MRPDDAVRPRCRTNRFSSIDIKCVLHGGLSSSFDFAAARRSLADASGYRSAAVAGASGDEGESHRGFLERSPRVAPIGSACCGGRL
jgi:hypothetical protein